MKASDSWQKMALRLDLLMIYPYEKDRGLRLRIEQDVWQSIDPRVHEALRVERLKAAFKDVKQGPIKEGWMAAHVLQYAHNFNEKRGKLPSKNGAFRHVANAMENNPNIREVHKDNVRKAFNKHCQRSHFWLAREILLNMPDAAGYVPFAPDERTEYSLEGWQTFLNMAEIWRVWGTRVGFLKGASRVEIKQG